MSEPKRIARTSIVACFLTALAAMHAAAQPASQETEPVPEGWVRAAFDFADPDLDFETFVPAGASVETTAMEPREEGALGRIIIVGKVYPGETEIPVEVTVQAFDFATPAAASRVCANEAGVAGYTLRATNGAPDFSQAELFATQTDGNRALGGIFSRCLARGHKMLAIHFLFDVSDTRNDEERDARAAAANAYYRTFIGNLTFADGRFADFRDTLRRIPVVIGETRTELNVPDVWQVPINDFRGGLPAELHMLRRNAEGKDTGLVWLAVMERREKPDLEELGPPLVSDYFVKQSPEVQRPVLLASGVGPDLSQVGAETRSFRFSVQEKGGDETSEILALLFWHEGRLYVLSLWSAWAPTADRMSFFSRLPGLTTFDMISAELARLMVEEEQP